MLHKRSRGPELSEPTLPGTRQFQNCHHHGEPGGGAVGQRNPASLSRRQVSGPWSGVPAAVSPCRVPTNTAHGAGAQGRSTKAGQVVPLKKSTQTNKETTEAPARACAAGGGAQGLHSSPTTGWRALRERNGVSGRGWGEPLPRVRAQGSRRVLSAQHLFLAVGLSSRALSSPSAHSKSFSLK